MIAATRMKRRAPAVLVAMALVIAAPFGVAGSASAAPETVVKHVALGDSVAAGQGGGIPLDACARTDGGYGSQLDETPKFNMLRNAACTGSTIEDVAAQISQVNRGTTVVTLTVGANDLGIDALYQACAAVAAGADPSACLDQALAAANAAPSLVAPLTALILDIAERAPNATIIVTGYPHLLEAPPASSEFIQLALLVAAVNSVTDALNGAIQAAVAAAAATGADVRYADVVDAFEGHGVQLVPFIPSDPWFGTDPVNDPAGYLHPTYAGYSAYADVIQAVLTGP